MILKYIPGVLGAITSFVTLQFIGWFDNWSLELAAYIIVYLFVTVSLDKALVRYGAKSAN